MRSHRVFNLAVPAAALLLLLPAPRGESQEQADFVAVKGMDERFRLDLGGFFQKFTTTIRVDSPTTGRGTEINLEDDLGISSNQANIEVNRQSIQSLSETHRDSMLRFHVETSQSASKLIE